MSITKKDIKFYSVVTILVVLFIMLILTATKTISQYANSQKYKGLPVIILDAGHGGEDGGSSANNGKILEKDINLQITKDLNDFFVASGFQTIMIREDDTALSDSGLSTIRKRKVSDMKNRVAIANADDNAILISIHQNKFSDSKYYGTQVFYSDNNSSKNLAESIRSSVVSLLQPDNTRTTKKASNSVYLLSNVKCPAVIVECGFLSNPSELQKLTDEEYQKEMAFSIFCGFMEYWHDCD